MAYCIDSFAVGGTELNAVRTAEALDKNEFKLSIYHFQQSGPLRPRYEALAVEMHHLPIPNLYSCATAAQGLRFGSLLRKWDADIVHSHDLYTNIFATTWARLSSKAKIIASRRWWFDAPRPGLSAVNRWSYKLADRVLANSAGVARLLSTVERVPDRKIVEIPNFLTDRAFALEDDAARLRKRAVWGLPNSAFVVGIVARLVSVKNHRVLLRAAALLDRDIHFVLIGDGPLREELQKQSRELGIADRIHFAGEIISQHNLHQYFDVSVLCSNSEGFPNSIIEALAAARPVVATDVGGVTDVIVNRKTGLLVAPDDPALIATAIQLLRSDSSLCALLGSCGQRFVREKFHESIVITKLASLYVDLARPRTGRNIGAMA